MDADNSRVRGRRHGPDRHRPYTTEKPPLSDTLAGAALGIGALGRPRWSSSRSRRSSSPNSMAWWEWPP